MDDSTRRLFIAIPLPNHVKKALGVNIETLKQQIPEKAVRWVRVDNVHLTLRFLGDTAVSKIPALIEGLNTLQDKHAPFHLQFSQFGCFPNKKRPRVLWIGLNGEMKQLVNLKQSLDQALWLLDYPVETRRYNPHLTLGRVKKSEQVAKTRWGGVVEPAQFQVTAVTLYQSKLTPQGANYTELHTAKLSKS